MKLLKTKIDGPCLIKTTIFSDKRGYLKETFKNNLIDKINFPFDLMSYSKKNVLRGLHAQTINPQGKYLSVIKGKIYDVMVDLRSRSKTFGQYFSVLLSEKNCKSVYIPEGFAHGFIALDNENIISYNCTNYRNAKSEITLKWNDSDINIKWPKIKPILSNKDNNGLSLNDFIKKVKNF